MDFSKSPARSRCSLPNSSRQVMVKARSIWCPSRCRLAVSDDDLEVHQLEVERSVRSSRVGLEHEDFETGIWRMDPQDGRGHGPGQEDRAGDVKGAEFQSPAACRCPGRFGFEKHELDGMFVWTEGRRWRRSIRRPQHRASASRNAEHEDKEWHGALSPLGRDLLEPRWSSRTDLQRLGRLLRHFIVRVAHMQDHTHCGRRASGYGVRVIRCGPRLAAAAPAPYPSAVRSPGRG